MTEDLNVEDVAAEAREDYDLEARLRGIPRNTDTVTLFTDEVTGKKLGGARDERNQLGMVVGRERWGILGEIDRVKALPTQDEDTEAQIAALREEALVLLESLNKGAFVVTLRSVPPEIIKGCRRRAKKTLGIKSKNIPDDISEEFEAELMAEQLHETIIAFTDNADGIERKGVSVRNARAFKRLLPPHENMKLELAFADLQWKNVISEAATDDADF